MTRIPTAAELYELAYYASADRDFELLDFLRRLLHERAPGRRILDCACGTGEPTLWLADEFEVTLSDASEDLVRIARDKAARARLRPLAFQVAEWASLAASFQIRFDAVLCTGNALAQSTTRQARLSALRGMHAVLDTGGLLYVDFRASYAPSTDRPTLAEVIGPLAWHEEQLAVLVFELGSSPPLIERVRDYYRVSPGHASLLASTASHYLPFTGAEIEADLTAVGFGQTTFHDRPGFWSMPAVTAIRRD